MYILPSACSFHFCRTSVLTATSLARAPPELAHRPYVDILPAPSKLRTPLHFTQAELDLFRGTNLWGATLDRQRSWEAEWEDCREFLESHSEELGGSFTWNEYLTASTYLSSRAFPSSLLSETPSLVTSPTSYPVLLPGVDSLNHARAQPVSWVVAHPNSTTSFTTQCVEPTISLVLHTPTPAGAELFNNYGPKPNAELILGYGFALRDNPDDTIVLKIGGAQPEGEGANSKWEVGRDARGAEPVWEAVQAAVHAQNRYDVEEDERDSYSTEDELWATEVLAEMAEDLLSRLPEPPAEDGESTVRPEVAEMLGYYVEGAYCHTISSYRTLKEAAAGQRDVLHSLMDFAKSKEERIIESARERGIEIVEEPA